MVGYITITTSSEHEIDFHNFLSATILPSDITKLIKIETDAEFVLVVEKDTVFQRLLNDKIFARLNRKFILLTVSQYLI